MASLVRECCGIYLPDDAIDPEYAEDWIAVRLIRLMQAERLIKEALPLIDTAERIKPKERNPDRNAKIRADRQKKMTLGELAQKYKTTIAAIRGVLRRTK